MFVYEVFVVRLFPHSFWYGELVGKSPYTVQMWKNTDQKSPNMDAFHTVAGVTELMSSESTA